MPELNEKQRAFCREYLKDSNGTQAAIRAGYSAKTAGQQAEQHLKKLEIQSYLTELRAPVEAAAAFTYEDACRIMAEIATTGKNDSDRVRATDRLAKLRGWDQPHKVAPTTPDGSAPYQPPMTPEVAVATYLAAISKAVGDA